MRRAVLLASAAVGQWMDWVPHYIYNALNPSLTESWSGPSNLPSEGRIVLSSDLNNDDRTDFILSRDTDRGPTLDVVLWSPSHYTALEGRYLLDDLAEVQALDPGLPVSQLHVDGVHPVSLGSGRQLLVVFTARTAPSPPFMFLVMEVESHGSLRPRAASVRFMSAEAELGPCQTRGMVAPGIHWLGVASSSYPFIMDTHMRGQDDIFISTEHGLQIVSFEGRQLACGSFAEAFPMSERRRLAWWNPTTWFRRASNSTQDSYKSKVLVDSVMHPKRITHFPLTPPAPVDVPAPQYVLPRHHSSALVDLNGDCHADLALQVATSTGSELHLFLSDPGSPTPAFLRNPLILPLPLGAQFLEWTDIDADGLTDLVFASCDTAEPAVAGVPPLQANLYDEYRPCSKSSRLMWTQAMRRDLEAAPVDEGWRGILRRFRESLSATKVQPCAGYDVGFSSLMEMPLEAPFNFSSLGVPLRLVTADLDSSGYPDLLFAAVDEKGIPSFVVYENSPAKVEDVTLVPDSRDLLPAHPRTFNPGRTFYLTDGINPHVKAEVLGTLTESDAPGGWNLVLFHPRGELRPQIHTKEPSFDSFFLSPILRNADGSKPRGASTKISFTDINGRIRSRTLVTAGQTCPGPNSPEVNVGLGRLSTYIDYVAVGLPGGGAERIWSNLIPNATFYLTIHLPEDPTSWRLHWSVPPLKLFWPMLLATLVALGFAETSNA
ncbi:MAG: uncharacterized protein KVP18_002311 [Porospora cf. gigantea A]|uniref:uncharacterized protein n=1 Tax=Porospora cf. gigantea A TaxID=2853593 RepID=UPI00355A2EAB|nr:MAG: hypothetical protein KVP18_002311 [Porospora cf. gigantea A]